MTGPVVHHDDNEDIRQEVEDALERYKKPGLTTEEDLDYRIHVRRAIDALPIEDVAWKAVVFERGTPQHT